MSERLAVDSLMTADGEVVQLPTLGPLGPVDAEGGRIPLDTVRLFDAEGRFLKLPVLRGEAVTSAVELFRATAWRTVPDLVSGPARRALVHGRADAPRVTSAQIGETERRARALERDRARALKRSRKAKR
jgi:hypothetical protein